MSYFVLTFQDIEIRYQQPPPPLHKHTQTYRDNLTLQKTFQSSETYYCLSAGRWLQANFSAHRVDNFSSTAAGVYRGGTGLLPLCLHRAPSILEPGCSRQKHMMLRTTMEYHTNTAT